MSALAGIFVDANLLVLRIVGDVDRDLVARHRRLSEFTPEDYDLFVRFTSRYGHLVVTPNTLPEASNLVTYHSEPDRSRFLEKLRSLIHETKEVVVSSAHASENPAFVRLGLTDAALLEAISREQPLVTVDLKLYLAALAKDECAAVNFTHYQHRTSRSRGP